MNIRKHTINLLVGVIATTCLMAPMQAIADVQPVKNKTILLWAAAISATLACGTLAAFAAYNKRQKNGVFADELKSRAAVVIGQKLINNDAMTLNGLKAEIADYLGESRVAAIEESVDDGTHIINYQQECDATINYLKHDNFAKVQNSIGSSAWWSCAAWLKPHYVFLCQAYAVLYLRSKVLAARNNLVEKKQQRELQAKVERYKQQGLPKRT